MNFRCFPGIKEVGFLNTFLKYAIELYYFFFLGRFFNIIAMILSGPGALLFGSFLIMLWI